MTDMEELLQIRINQLDRKIEDLQNTLRRSIELLTSNIKATEALYAEKRKHDDRLEQLENFAKEIIKTNEEASKIIKMSTKKDED